MYQSSKITPPPATTAEKMIADETEAAKEVIHSQRIEIASRTNPLCYTVASFFIFQQLNMSSEHIHIHPIVVGADGHSRIDCNSNSKREESREKKTVEPEPVNESTLS